MTNQAEKKRAIEARQKCTIFAYLAWAITLWFVLFRVMFHWESMTVMLMVGLVINVGVEFGTYQSIRSSILDGLEYETMLDIFGLSLIVLLIGSFTDWAWLCYLLIPGFICYKCGGFLLSWADRSGKGAEETQEEPAGRNRRERRQAKASNR